MARSSHLNKNENLPIVYIGKNGGLRLKIHIENQVLEFDNNIKEIDEILEALDNIINKSSKILSHLVIDGIEVFGDYYDYFLDNITEIEKIQVIMMTHKELINDTLISTVKYIRRTRDAIEDLSNDFYKKPNQDSWQGLNDLLGGISWLINTFSSIDGDTRLKDMILIYESWNLYAKEVFSVQELLRDFEEALQNNDNITIADILLYEIPSIFTQMEKTLLELVGIEEDFHDFN